MDAELMDSPEPRFIEPRGAESTNHFVDEEQDDSNKKKKKFTIKRCLRRMMMTVGMCLAPVIDRCLDCFDICIKCVGPVFMCIAFSLFSFETYTYFAYVVPFMGENTSLAGQAFVTLVGLFLLLNMLYNYLKAMFTDPGLPPEWDSSSLVEDVEDGAALRKPNRCSRCKRQKPQRTHHCSVCKRCVLKMDHHCPWINNCVGFGNYRYFCLFMMYLAICCVFVAVIFFEAFVETITTSRSRRLSFNANQCISMCWIIATAILFALSILGGFHVYLLLTNQTTIEFHVNMSKKGEARRRGEIYRNPYNLGRAENFKQVYGFNFCSFKWALSFLAHPPVGDGTSFPSMTFAKA